MLNPSPMSTGALRHCSYAAWYQRYAQLAPDSVIIRLTDDFAEFLAAEGVAALHSQDTWGHIWALHANAASRDPSPSFTASNPPAVTAASTSSSTPCSAPNRDAMDHQLALSVVLAQRFSDLVSDIEAAIARLGGAVAPKLNWSAPVDAAPLTPAGGTSNDPATAAAAAAAAGAGAAPLRCASAEQVVALLLSSERVGDDLQLIRLMKRQAERLGAHVGGTGAGSGGEAGADLSLQLVLRRWQELDAKCEFRCYIEGHRPVAVVQRHMDRVFEELQDAGLKARLRDAVCEFHQEHFGDGFACTSYVIDMHVPREGPILLLDVNPVAGMAYNDGALLPGRWQGQEQVRFTDDEWLSGYMNDDSDDGNDPDDRRSDGSAYTHGMLGLEGLVPMAGVAAAATHGGGAFGGGVAAEGAHAAADLGQVAGAAGMGQQAAGGPAGEAQGQAAGADQGEGPVDIGMWRGVPIVVLDRAGAETSAPSAIQFAPERQQILLAVNELARMLLRN